MDFSLSEEQLAVRETAEGLFARAGGPERVSAVEATTDRFDAELWVQLAEADLLGLVVPAELGGAGMGLIELCLLLEAQGQVVAPVPLWATLVLGALPVARFGSPAQRRQLLADVAGGRTRLTAALNGTMMSVTGCPPVAARRFGDAWVLDGVERAVPHAHLADRVLVPALGPEGVVVALVDPAAPGVELDRAVTTDRQVHPNLRLESVTVATDQLLGAVPGDDATSEVAPVGSGALGWMVEAAATGLCALQVGVCESALRQTAAYCNERTQFGRALSNFQATLMRAADAAIDIEAMRVTLWQAAWRLDTGRPATEAVAVAKWQAAERGQRVVHAAQHLHGGIGADVTYPIHRYFLWGKQIELMLGGPGRQLDRLGHQLATRFGDVAG